METNHFYPPGPLLSHMKNCERLFSIFLENRDKNPENLLMLVFFSISLPAFNGGSCKMKFWSGSNSASTFVFSAMERLDKRDRVGGEILTVEGGEVGGVIDDVGDSYGGGMMGAS